MDKIKLVNQAYDLYENLAHMRSEADHDSWADKVTPEHVIRLEGLEFAALHRLARRINTCKAKAAQS